MITVVLILLAILTPPFIVWVRMRKWQFSVTSAMAFTGLAAIICFLARQFRDVDIYFPWDYGLLPFILLAWMFLISWINSSLFIGIPLRPITEGIGDIRENAKRGRLRFGRSSAALPQYPLLIAVFYVVFHKTWMAGAWPFLVDHPTLWSETNPIGVSLRTFDHAVNAMFVIYVSLALWTRATMQRQRWSIVDTAYVIVLVLLVAKHFAVPPF